MRTGTWTLLVAATTPALLAAQVAPTKAAPPALPTRAVVIAYRGFSPGVTYREFADRARPLTRRGADPLACNTSKKTAQLMECGVLIRDPADSAGFYLGAYVIEGRVAMISFGDSGGPHLVDRMQRELRAQLGAPHAVARGTWQWRNGRRALKLNWRGRGSARWIYIQLEDGDLLAHISRYTATGR
jgi:hypothetical protein